MKMRVGIFEKKNKIDKSSPKRRKKGIIQINKIISKMRHCNWYHINMKNHETPMNIICQHIGNLEQMDKILETHTYQD